LAEIFSENLGGDFCLTLQEQSAEALQAIQNGRAGEGVSDDGVCESGAEDDQALAAMSLPQVQ